MAWQDPPGQPEWRDAYGQYGQEPQDTPPPGWTQDPYGQGPYTQGPYAHDPYAQDPYGQNAYTQDPYGRQNPYAQDPYGQYSYGPPGVGARGGTGLTVAALVANIVSAVLCCGIGLAWIPGIVLAAIALSRNATDPVSARKLTIGAWVCFGIDVVLTVVGLIVLGLVGGDHSSTNTY